MQIIRTLCIALVLLAIASPTRAQFCPYDNQPRIQANRANQAKVGMTEAQIIQALGKPPCTFAPAANNRIKNKSFWYFIQGASGPFVIRFGGDGRVIQIANGLNG